MVDAKAEIITAWCFLSFSFGLLCFRLYVRSQETGRWLRGLKKSDFLILFAFICTLGASALVTDMAVREIRFMDENPKLLHDQDGKSLDPAVLLYRGETRVIFYKCLFATIYCDILSLWASKIAILVFYYEIFPKRRAYRWILHICAVILVGTLVAAVFQTTFWCKPISDLWLPELDPKRVCNIKLNPDYIRAQAGFHISTVGLVIILPILIITQIAAKRSEMAFALTVLALGSVSIAGSVSAFFTLLKVALDLTNHARDFAPEARHEAVVLHLVDLNCMFIAGCLSALKIRVHKKPPPMRSNALEIVVENSWTVQVEMVSAWGGEGDKDPLYGGSTKTMSIHQRGRKNVQPDIEVMQLTRGSGHSRVPLERSESATGFV